MKQRGRQKSQAEVVTWKISPKVTFEPRPEGSEGATQLHEKTCQAKGMVGAKALTRSMSVRLELHGKK